MALRPEERYGSALALAEDVEQRQPGPKVVSQYAAELNQTPQR